MYSVKEYKELREFFRTGMNKLLRIDDEIDDDGNDIDIEIKTKQDLKHEVSNEQCDNDELFYYQKQKLYITCPSIERIDHILNTYQQLRQQQNLWVCT